MPLSQSTGSAPAGRAIQSIRGSVWPKEEVHRPGPLLCNPEGQARGACASVEGEGSGLQAPPRARGRACGKRSERAQAETSQPRRIAIAQVGVCAEVLTYSATAFPTSLSGLCCSKPPVSRALASPHRPVVVPAL